MQSQSVSEIKKIMKKIGEKLTETGLIILTFSTPDHPDEVKVGYENTPVRTYIPYPLRCFNCFKFGHPTKYCTLDKKCCNCSLPFHTNPELNEQCKNEKNCINCEAQNMINKNHNTMDKKCPIFLKEKEIQAIKTTKKVDGKKAREIYNQRNQTNSSFASVTRPTVNYNTLNMFDRNVPTTTSSLTSNTSDHTCNKHKSNISSHTCSETNLQSTSTILQPSTLPIKHVATSNAPVTSPTTLKKSKIQIVPKNLSKRKKAELKAKLRKTPKATKTTSMSTDEPLSDDKDAFDDT